MNQMKQYFSLSYATQMNMFYLVSHYLQPSSLTLIQLFYRSILEKKTYSSGYLYAHPEFKRTALLVKIQNTLFHPLFFKILDYFPQEPFNLTYW